MGWGGRKIITEYRQPGGDGDDIVGRGADGVDGSGDGNKTVGMGTKYLQCYPLNLQCCSY